MTTYDKYRWNAKTYKSDTAILTAIKQFRIEGKTIQNINVIGYADNISKENFEQEAYATLYQTGIPFDSIHVKQHTLLEKVLINCSACVCEPTVLLFTDGSTFEFQPTSDGMKMSVNQLSVAMKDGLNRQNFYPSKMFSEIIGATVRDVVLHHKSHSKHYHNHIEDTESRTSLEILTAGDYGIKATQINWHHQYRYFISLTKPLYGEAIVKKPLYKMLPYVNPIYHLPIYEGLGSGGCFWIGPVKRANKNDYNGLAKNHDCISIDEDIVFEKLSKYLLPHFDSTYNQGLWHHNCDIPPVKFEWNDDNDYTYDAIRQMIAAMRADVAAADDTLDSAESDFLTRLCDRLEKMMAHTPQYHIITFSGP